MSDLKKMLEEVIEKDLGDLRDIEHDAEERRLLVDGVDKLYKLHQEDEKMEEEKEARKERNSNDLKIGLLGKIGDMVMSGVSIAAFVGLARTMFKFEETGTIAASASRLIINRFGKLK